MSRRWWVVTAALGLIVFGGWIGARWRALPDTQPGAASGNSSPVEPVPASAQGPRASMSHLYGGDERVGSAFQHRARETVARMQRNYEESIGIRLPSQYQHFDDESKLRARMAGGDRYAAVRLGNLLADRGDFDGAVAAYQRAAELGAVAPLADAVAQWFDPQQNPARDDMTQRLGHAPPADFAAAYDAAWSAYLGGYLDAGMLVDRMRRTLPPNQRAAYDSRAMEAYFQLMEAQRVALGAYPSVPLSPAELAAQVRLMQANFRPVSATCGP